MGVPRATPSPPCAWCEAVPSPTVTGEIRSTHRLEVAHTHLIVRAYNALHPTDHATATLNITVQGTDQRAPSCVPAIVVYGLGWGAGCGSAPPCPGQWGQKLSRWPPHRRSQVPETMSPGSTLVTLRCTGTEGDLRYALEGPPASRSRFRMDGPQLQVSGSVGSSLDPAGRQQDRGDPLTCAVTLGPQLGLPGALCPSQPARSSASLPPAPLPAQPCGTPRLCGTAQLCLTTPVLAWQVNTTLDYDSDAADTMGFQFTATIVVMAGGQPPQSSECPQRGVTGQVMGEVGKAPSRPQNQQVVKGTLLLMLRCPPQGYCHCPHVPQPVRGEHTPPSVW